MGRSISIYASHDSSLCFDAGEGKYVIFEFERLLKERYCKINDSANFQWAMEESMKIIEEFYGIESFDVCYYGQFLPKREKEQMNIFSSVFGVDRFVEVGHHISHAAGAFYQSPFNESLILSFDGGGFDDGEVSTFNVYLGNRKTNEITHIDRVDIDFGNSYSLMAFPVSEIRKGNFLSYAGKIMGLAAYGNIREEWVDNMKLFYISQRFDGSKHQLMSFGRSIGLNLSENALNGQDSYDLAATSQYVFEEMVLDIFLPYVAEYKLPICLTGGCALNVLFNEKLRKMVEYPIYVPPNPNDCGLSLGQLLLHEPPNRIVNVTYSGFPVLDRKRLPEYAQVWTDSDDFDLVRTIKPKDLIPYLKAGKIIGVVNGDSECGPRALGNRSIICDPSYKSMKDILNAKVKYREWFRPFAPITLEERVSDYFDFAGESPYMSYAPMVKDEYREALAAITHEDGTARVQTVRNDQNSFMYNLIKEFGEETGIPVLLNTSFNIKGKPILTTLSDALSVLGETDLDYVYYGGLLFGKKLATKENDTD